MDKVKDFIERFDENIETKYIEHIEFLEIQHAFKLKITFRFTHNIFEFNTFTTDIKEIFPEFCYEYRKFLIMEFFK